MAGGGDESGSDVHADADGRDNPSSVDAEGVALSPIAEVVICGRRSTSFKGLSGTRA